MATQKVLDLLQFNSLLDDKTTYSYGTAGFRFKVEHMDGIMLRVGIVSAFILDKEENMGVMVTASHNDESYNGVKLSNPDGSMLDATNEKLLVDWVNERSLGKWKAHLEQFQLQSKATFHVGYDTRSHSERLANLLIQGAQAMGVTVNNHGVLTTPMLHHIVLHSNPSYLPEGIQSCPSRDGYIQAIAQAYLELLKVIAPSSTSNNNPLVVDCACGVGYEAVQQACEVIQKASSPSSILPLNKPGDGPLNTDCGSEHVQKQLQPPTWYSSPSIKQSYCCSLDGDADRIVFFSSAHNKLILLDGDKIAVLIGQFLQKELAKCFAEMPNLPKITVGVVQTAYANGASTNYLQDVLKVPVVITKTGVKHLHHAALDFDVGIYFEANGHGTVLFSETYHKFAAQANNKALSILPRLINPAVGDALSDLLLVDALLKAQNWTLDEWNALYTDLPSRQLKIQVADRSVVKCNDNETKCLAPASLQPALEELMKTTKRSRTFCRASGTENVVRVYAEAPTRDQADKVATVASQLVHEHCGGIGPLSSI